MDGRPYDLQDLPALADEADQDYRVILNGIVPPVIARFAESGKDYGGAFKLLGEKGQFSDINRKFWKLYNAIWLDQPLGREPVEEVAEDIIGHCLLLIYLRTSALARVGGPILAPTPSHVPASPPDPRPTLQDVLAAVERGADGTSRDGTAVTRIKDNISALYVNQSQE